MIRKLILSLVLLTCGAYAQSFSAITPTNTASTIVIQWTTSTACNTQAAGATMSGGPYTINPADSGLASNGQTQNGTTHNSVFADLAANTTYYFQLTCGGANSGQVTVSTCAEGTYSSTQTTACSNSIAKNPIQGLYFHSIIDTWQTLGSEGNSVADTYNNVVDNRGVVMHTANDSEILYGGANCNGCVAQFTPYTSFPGDGGVSLGSPVNALTGVQNGVCSAVGGASVSTKQFGLVSWGGNLYMPMSRQQGVPNGTSERGFTIITSQDHGNTWNNWSSPGTFTSTGVPANLTVTNATDAAPIVITTSGTIPYANGGQVYISGVGGNTNANGNWYIQVLSSTSFALYSDYLLSQPSSGNAAYTSGGTVEVLCANPLLGPALLQMPQMGSSETVTGASYSSPTVTATVSGTNTFGIGQTINVTGITPAAYNCQWCIVTAATASTVSYAVASNPGTYTSGGSLASQPTGGVSAPILWGQDDGSGIWGPGQWHVYQSDAYFYFYNTLGQWIQGTNLYLFRIPWAKVINANPADIEWYSGPVPAGAHDYATAANWQANGSATPPVNLAANCLNGGGWAGEVRAQYVPMFGQFVLWMTHSEGTQSSLICEGPTPAGPFTAVDQYSELAMDQYGVGLLHQSVLNMAPSNPSAVTISSGGEYISTTDCTTAGQDVRFSQFRVTNADCTYRPYFQAMTFETAGDGARNPPVPISWGGNKNAIPGQGLAYASMNFRVRGGNQNTLWDLNTVSATKNDATVTLDVPALDNEGTNLNEWSPQGLYFYSGGSNVTTPYSVSGLTNATVAILFATEPTNPPSGSNTKIVYKISSTGFSFFRAAANSYTCNFAESSPPYGANLTGVSESSSSGPLAFHLVFCRYNHDGKAVVPGQAAEAAGTIDVLLDGESSIAATYAGAVSTLDNAPLIIGGSGSGWKGYIPMVLVWNRMLSNAEVCRAYTAMYTHALKWGITLTAPACSAS